MICIISLENISKKFHITGSNDDFFEAVSSVSLQIEAGSIYGIIGESGAGKSTLLRMINLLEIPDTGNIVVDGQSLTSMNEALLRGAKKKIAMIFQQFNLLSNINVLDNVAMPLKLAGVPAKERKERALECLNFVGLVDKAKQYPGKLSGGQKQRVAIARAIAHQPSVLLCDEPTSALDVNTTREILNVLKQVNETFHTTIVLVTHQLDVVRAICHQVSVMEQGRLVDTFQIPQQVAVEPKLSYRQQLLGRQEDSTC